MSRRREIISLVMLCCALAAHSVHAEKKAKKADFFDDDRLHTIHIHLSAAAWNSMQPVPVARYAPDPVVIPRRPPTTSPTTRAIPAEGQRLKPSPHNHSYAYYRSTIDIDGDTLANAAIRFKGNISYTITAAMARRPFKIEFDRFVPARLFRGISTLNLSNNTLDPTGLREALAHAAFRDAKLPAPRTAIAAVYLTVDGIYNREYLGVYTLIEQIDDRFLKRYFGKAGGMLLKPEGLRGLPYLGEQWPAYAQRFNPRGGDKAAESQQRLIDFVRLVHFADDGTFRARIESFLDVDEFLKFIAVQTLIANTDSFLFTGHNYYLYFNPRDGRISWMPWDMHLSFGSFSIFGTQPQQIDLSVRRPFVQPNWLLERLLAIEPYAKRYEEDLRQLSAGPLSRDRLLQRIQKLRAIVAPADALARAAGKYGSPTTRPLVGGGVADPPPLEAFIAARSESVAAQLVGKREGFAPGPWRGMYLAATWNPTRAASLTESASGLFLLADANADGKVTEVELCAAGEAWFKQADTSGRGAIGLRELAISLSGHMRMPSGFVFEPGPGPSWAAIIFARADANGDGVLTRDELLAAIRTAFRQADKAKAGFLTEPQLIEAVRAIAAADPMGPARLHLSRS